MRVIASENRARSSRIAQCLRELDTLTRKESMSKSQRSRCDYLMAELAALRGGHALQEQLSPEIRAWSCLLRGQPIPTELRDMVEGTEAIGSWSAGPEGGFFVPQEMHRETIDAVAQTDPLFSENDVNLLVDENGQARESADVPEGLNTPTGRLRPRRVAGFDLSQIASSQVGEGAQGTATAVSVSGIVLNGFMHKIPLPVSLEFEQDSFKAVVDLLVTYFGAAFARGMGPQLVTGTGSGQPGGVLTQAANSGVTTAAAGALSLDDLDSIYFSVDRAYRASPKCRWLMNDVTYSLARKALTSGGYPLFSPVEDREVIYGKPVLISPSMPSAAGSKGIVFGDFRHFAVRLGSLSIERTLTYIEKGQALYNGRMRVDSAVFDPSAGGKPPIVYATLHV